MLLTKPASPSAKPPTTHSFLLAISFNTLTTKLMQLSKICKTLQYRAKQGHTQ